MSPASMKNNVESKPSLLDRLANVALALNDYEIDVSSRIFDEAQNEPDDNLNWTPLITGKITRYSYKDGNLTTIIQRPISQQQSVRISTSWKTSYKLFDAKQLSLQAIGRANYYHNLPEDKSSLGHYRMDASTEFFAKSRQSYGIATFTQSMRARAQTKVDDDIEASLQFPLILRAEIGFNLLEDYVFALNVESRSNLDSNGAYNFNSTEFSVSSLSQGLNLELSFYMYNNGNNKISATGKLFIENPGEFWAGLDAYCYIMNPEIRSTIMLNFGWNF